MGLVILGLRGEVLDRPPTWATSRGRSRTSRPRSLRAAVTDLASGLVLSRAGQCCGPPSSPSPSSLHWCCSPGPPAIRGYIPRNNSTDRSPRQSGDRAAEPATPCEATEIKCGLCWWRAPWLRRACDLPGFIRLDYKQLCTSKVEVANPRFSADEDDDDDVGKQRRGRCGNIAAHCRRFSEREYVFQ